MTKLGKFYSILLVGYPQPKKGFETLGTPDRGYLHPGFLDYWFAPGARPHLHLQGVTEGRGSVFKAHSAGHPLKRGGT